MKGNKRYWENWNTGGTAQSVDQYWHSSPLEAEWRKMLVADIEIEIGPGAQILEVGCGSGVVYGEMLKHHIVTPESYVGGDVSEKMLEIARERFPEAKFTTLDILGLPYLDKSQANVICIQVFQHLPHYAKALKELIRITGRRLYITSWFNKSPKDKITFDHTPWDASFYNNCYSLPKFLDFLYRNADIDIERACVKHLAEPSYSISLTLK